MNLHIHATTLEKIHQHARTHYPEEGAGLLLGHVNGDARTVTAILPLENAREAEARHNRYLITPYDMMNGEDQAEKLGLDVIGIFHSHPDHPNLPSTFDQDWALPWYSYIITSVLAGKATASRSWRLTDDRAQFNEETLVSVEDPRLPSE